MDLSIDTQSLSIAVALLKMCFKHSIPLERVQIKVFEKTRRSPLPSKEDLKQTCACSGKRKRHSERNDEHSIDDRTNEAPMRAVKNASLTPLSLCSRQ